MSEKWHRLKLEAFQMSHYHTSISVMLKKWRNIVCFAFRNVGANKRDAGVTSPLDLSSPGGFAPRKRQRLETRRSESVSPKPKPTARPTTPPPVRCPSLCGHMPCGDGQAVNRWTIEDVVNYVSSIDICAEYAQVSRGKLSYRARLRFSPTKSRDDRRVLFVICVIVPCAPWASFNTFIVKAYTSEKISAAVERTGNWSQDLSLSI